METIKDVFITFKKVLSAVYESNELEAITLLTVSEILHLSKATIKAFPEQKLSGKEVEKLNDVLSQLKTGRPIQYILGTTEFYGLPFNVNPSVLIPRPETEELVEWMLASVGSRQWAVGGGQLAVKNILDIGTGSGCIAISLKKKLPYFNITGIDISEDALETAKENAQLNHVEVNFINVDILNPTSDILNPTSDIIISNPPYVTLHDKNRMHTNVTDFEPHTALFVPENDPLIFYRVIADFAVKNLAVNGLLFFEINEVYGKKIVDILNDKGFKNIELRKDMSGKDRMIKASA